MTKTDISKLDIGSDLDTVAACNAGLEVELLSPRDQSKTGIIITVTGKDGDAFREAVQENLDAYNRRAQLARQRGKPLPSQSQAEQEEEGIDLLVVCTLGWQNMVVDGKELEFNVPNAKAVYRRFPWIRKQVDDAIGDIEGFLKAFKKN